MMDELFQEAVQETADGMTEEQAWMYVRDLPEEISATDEWMAMYLAKKFPSIVQRLKEQTDA
jgi:hypothetical protein